jgi:hypothetical protein
MIAGREESSQQHLKTLKGFEKELEDSAIQILAKRKEYSQVVAITIYWEKGLVQETHDLIISMQKQIEDEIGRLEVHFGERNTVLRLLMKLLGDVPEPTKCPESLDVST